MPSPTKPPLSALASLQRLKHDLDLAKRQAEQHAKQQAERDAIQQAEQQKNSPDLFLQAVQGVTPLHPTPASPPTRVRQPRKPDAQTLARRAAATGVEQSSEAVLSDTQALLHPVASEEFLSFRQATLQHRIFDQLKSGKLRWFEAVDLHGCTIEQARSAVLTVIEMAQAANQNVVKIVHGKGPQATLKTCVNGWLRQHRDVLAFVSAPPEQGGTGAVLVLLKRSEPRGAR
ncbi:MAG: Smr/MutS family protein [Pseudomonadota bacterium]|nr:Smr/MutS family protein [Pseudomonadota bacterium]